MSGETILIIDDSREIVKHLTEYMLPTFGYQTLYAYDGQTGLQLIRDKKPDLVMLDLHLPEMTGTDVLQQMAKESLSTPVVLMTGYGSEQSAIDAFRLGAKDYIIKPFTVDEIVDTIDRALVEPRLLHDKEELAEQLRRAKVELSRQAHEMETLSNIGKAIASLLSVDQVLERVLEAATQLTGAEESTIWKLEEDGRYLLAYGKKNGDAQQKPQDKILIADSQIGQVLQTGRPWRQSRSSGQGIKLQEGVFARAVLFVPLKLRGLTLGVLGVSNKVAFRAFSKQDEFLLSFLADYAAIALENARVFQAADQALAGRLVELNVLGEITRTITSTLELDEVVRLTINQVHDSWRIEASSLWWLDESGKLLKVLANVGTPSEILSDVRLPVDEGIAGAVARTGKWIYSNDVATHPLHFRKADELTGFVTRSLLCVPLVFRRQVVGVMELLNKLDGDFDDQDVERALSIASAVAIAVSNALLFQEAEARKQHLEATLEHNNSPILITDVRGRVLLLNQEARKRLNLAAEAIGNPVAQVIHPPEVVALLTEPIVETAEDLVLPDGSVWLPRVAPIPGHGRILILQNITHLRELDKAKDHFVATVSHDMRAPLTQLRELVRSLDKAGPLNEKQSQTAAQILQATEKMMGLVDGLLELAKVNTGLEYESRPCDLLELVTEVVDDFQVQALARRVALLLTAEPGICIVNGNPTQLRRAISNLLDNAIKFSPENDTVEIMVVGDDSHVLVKVCDKGEGIAESDKPYIFETFYRGKDVAGYEGSGLGLALVYSIAQAHGGKIWVESENGGGSTFVLDLPVEGSPG
jgi:two-component system NtrC family sensor kinase